MKRSEIEVGGIYTARVSGKVVPVKVLDAPNAMTGRKSYLCKSLTTGRELTFKSALRFRKAYPPEVAERYNLSALTVEKVGAAQ